MQKSIIIRAPASTSNLGSGYDVYGLALDLMYDEVEVTLVESGGIQIQIEGLKAEKISNDPQENSAGLASIEFLKKAHLDDLGLLIRIKKGIPPGSGLGSSGASSAGTVVALNHLFNCNFKKEILVEIASKGELIAAGSAHADNVAPSILGGFTVIYSYKPIKLLTFPPPKKISFAVAVPETIEKRTIDARKILPKHVSMNALRINIGGASMVLAGLLLENSDLVGKGMLQDSVIEPARKRLYPGYIQAKQAALASGASGVTLSGAGPSTIAVSSGRNDPKNIANAMVEAFENEGIRCKGYVTKPTLGAYVQIEKGKEELLPYDPKKS